MINEKIKFRNAILSDAKHLSKIESNIFPLDKVNTNFQTEISKETKKVFICTYENIVKPKKNLLSFIKPDKSKANQEFNTEEIIIGYIKIWKVLEESHIEQIGVIEKFRGQGIGEKLLVLSLRYCWENNIKKFYLNAENLIPLQ